MRRCNSTYLKPDFWRTFISAIAILCLMLSSCTVKASVKNLLGFKHSTEQSHRPAKHKAKLFVSSNSETCHYNQLSETIVVQKAGFDLSQNPLATFICCVFLCFLVGFRSESKETRHPLYNSSGKISGSVPIFLEYRKLILPHTL